MLSHVKQNSILIVDDTPENLTVLRQMLTGRGYRVQPALNGELALRMIQRIETLPDLILLDIMMPGMDGYDVCRRLKIDDQTHEIPVIFISALHDPLDKVKAFQAGGVDYISKPFHVEEVLARVETHLALRMLQKRLQDQNFHLQQEIVERKRAEVELAQANKELQRLAMVDGLTHIANRRCFDECLKKEWKRSAREQTPLSLILCDIDYFKRYNDTYGHQAGDECLRQVADALKTSAKRPADLVARYGGEEFIVILPHTNPKGAQNVAGSIQNALRERQLPHAASQVNEYVTLSLGASSLIPTSSDAPEKLIAEADAALYSAKEQGRNRIVFCL